MFFTVGRVPCREIKLKYKKECWKCKQTFYTTNFQEVNKLCEDCENETEKQIVPKGATLRECGRYILLKD
mgnify:FL=1|jgi:hypothetical protein